MFDLLLIAYFLLFLILAIKNLKWAVYLVIFTLPAYLIRFELVGLPMTLLEGEILLLFIVWIFKTRALFRIKKILIPDYWLLITSIFLFLLAATISIFISPDLRAAAGLWKAYFIEPILFLIVFVSVIKKKDFKNLLLLLGTQALLLSLFAIYQKFSGAFIPNPFWAAEATRRVTSFYSYPNALALFVAPITVMMIGVVFQRIKEYGLRNKHFFVSCFLFLVSFAALAAIYFTKSKGALLAVLAGIIFYALFYKGFRKYFVSILIIIFISLFLYISISDVNVAEVVKGSATVQGGDSISTRTVMWSETWQMLKTKPLLGAGLGGYQTAVASFHEQDYIEVFLYPHNIVLNFWTEIGLLGLIAFLSIMFWFYRTGIKNKKYELSIILMATMTTLLAHGLVDVPYFKNDLAVLFWIIIGMMIIIKKQKTINS